MEIQTLLTGLLGSSPLAAVLFFIWWSERKERIAEKDEHRAERKQYGLDYKELHERTLKGLHDANSIAAAVAETFAPERPAPPRGRRGGSAD